MSDTLTKTQRSWTMSRIRSRWTSPEKTVHGFLKRLKIKHKMHPKIEGSPDVTIPDRRKALFLHGCFWHKCSGCYTEPKTRRKYWLPKLEQNVQRDKENEKSLRRHGWKVVKIWEHELKKNKTHLPEFFYKKLIQK